MVKNPILLLLVLAFSQLSVKAQQRIFKERNLKDIPVQNQASASERDGDPQKPAARKSQNQNKQMSVTPLGTKIGRTYYDLQTNGSAGRRIVRHLDGTISAVWNEVCSPNSATTGYPTRGAGYNYHNGLNWIHGQTSPTSGQYVGTCNEPNGSNGPQFGIASKTVGFPEIVTTTNNQELVFAHASNGINITYRAAKGTGGMAGWNSTSDLTFSQNVLGAGNMGAWPRAASNGNSVHLIYALNKVSSSTSEPIINGVIQPFVYSRSLDGGLTWDRQNIILPGLTGLKSQPGGPVTNPEGFYKIGAANYAIAVNGNTVAIVAGSMGNPWTLWKSVDNGLTFTRRLISKVTPSDTILLNNAADTVAFVNDKALEVLVDHTGKVHVWAGELVNKVTSYGGAVFSEGFLYYPSVGKRLLYWNDDMPAGTKPVGIATIEDSRPLGDPFDFVANQLVGMPYFQFGQVSMPTAALDANNNIYLVYAAVVEGTSANGQLVGQPYRDLYVTKKSLFTNSWSNPINISRSLNLYSIGPPVTSTSAAENFHECVFPSVAPVVGADNFLHILFQSDMEPGTAVGPDQDTEAENHIMYLKFNVNPQIRGNENDEFLQSLSAYPNPTTGKVNIALHLKQPAMVAVSIKNLLGQEVATIKETSLSAGENQLLTDIGQLANGVYLYTVSSENFSVTKKLVKQ